MLLGHTEHVVQTHGTSSATHRASSLEVDFQGVRTRCSSYYEFVSIAILLQPKARPCSPMDNSLTAFAHSDFDKMPAYVFIYIYIFIYTYVQPNLLRPRLFNITAIRRAVFSHGGSFCTLYINASTNQKV